MRGLIAAFANSIPEDLEFNLAQRWVEAISLAAPALLSELPEQFLSYPTLGERFTLFIGGRIRYFKLVSVGFRASSDCLRAALKELGTLASSDIRSFFLKRYPHSDGISPIGFEPDSWDGGNVTFPDINHGASSYFFWVNGSATIGEWRWCVEVAG